ncbi:MAG: hypothetical protein QXU18_09740, partial [Thermoplasmatales archaeon]
FAADINSIIFVYGSKTDSEARTDFVSLESYSSKKVRQAISFKRKDLKPGKWFYLRAPKMFMEKIYPKLTHKLSDFADIKRGFTTGANDFFFMKDVSAQYEADYLANPKKFEEWGVKARNEKELKDQGLIYIENEGGGRFAIEAKSVIPLLRSPKEIQTFLIDPPRTLCLYVSVPDRLTANYIQYGEKMHFNKRRTVKSRKQWYKINELESGNILLSKTQYERFFVLFSKSKVLCSDRFYIAYPHNDNYKKTIWLFLNSTISLILMELSCNRQGGGARTLEVNDYERLLTPDLETLQLEDDETLLDRKPEKYIKEIYLEERRKLDLIVFEVLGIKNFSLDEFYKEFVDLVEDRLIRANRPLRSQEAGDEQDS